MTRQRKISFEDNLKVRAKIDEIMSANPVTSPRQLRDALFAAGYTVAQTTVWNWRRQWLEASLKRTQELAARLDRLEQLIGELQKAWGAGREREGVDPAILDRLGHLEHAAAARRMEWLALSDRLDALDLFLEKLGEPAAAPVDLRLGPLRLLMVPARKEVKAC